MTIQSLRRLLFATLFVATLALVPGCGGGKIPGLVPLQGVVEYEGVPLAWATLTFAPAPREKDSPAPAVGQRVATAMTDAQGAFVARTLGENGATPGEYVVTVEKYIAKEDGAVEKWEQARQASGYSEPAPEEDVFNAVSAIPLKYSDKKTSDLTITVGDKGEKNARFQLSK